MGALFEKHPEMCQYSASDWFAAETHEGSALWFPESCGNLVNTVREEPQLLS